ncbi:2-methylene-furan-3-one reductase [Cryptomeria japonica]|uniref:2-methylene-furan-3-one reductase n=1 Tax=Cryptomeria japonica TaxID=3369 RepID=UPI0027DA268B|nr:2-methylene-furan-3-one reductase [Cryptomeria japonica]
MMKAWFYKEHGSVNVLQFGEIEVPSLGPGQVLIKVRAAALNPVDFKLRQHGLRQNIAFPAVPGGDFAGVVVDVGDGVSKFEKGDEVYGDILESSEGNPRLLGTLAEYTAAAEHLLALKPSNLSFEEAASLPLALLTALLAFDTVDFHKGQSVFIVGGAGGVGSLAIQLAKNVFEASRIVSTCSTGKAEFVKSLGPDLVVDYTKQSYEQVDEKFDFVFDTIGESSKSHVVAKEEGKIVDIASFPPHPRAVNVRLMHPHGRNLERLSEYLESGKLKAVIDPKSPYAFSDVVEAFKHLESGRARGKIVISPI